MDTGRAASPTGPRGASDVPTGKVGGAAKRCSLCPVMALPGGRRRLLMTSRRFAVPADLGNEPATTCYVLSGWKAGESDRVDLLAGTEPAGLADDDHPAAGLFQHVDRRQGSLRPGGGRAVAGGSDPERAIPRRQRGLCRAGRAEQPAGDGTRRLEYG